MVPPIGPCVTIVLCSDVFAGRRNRGSHALDFYNGNFIKFTLVQCGLPPAVPARGGKRLLCVIPLHRTGKCNMFVYVEEKSIFVCLYMLHLVCSHQGHLFFYHRKNLCQWL